MLTQRIRRYSLSQQVADQLEAKIADGTYVVGEKIPPEIELAEMFAVSRNTLREAIQSLTSVGILEVRQGDGTYVRATNRFHAHMQKEYAKASWENIVEVRNTIEITIAELAAVRRTTAELEKIHTALLQRQQSQTLSKENTQSDINFHLAIAEACHNSILLKMYTSIFSYLEEHISSRQGSTKLAALQIDQLHQDLYDAIVEQNKEKAHICVQNILKI